MAVVIPDTSPSDLLSRFRGPIVVARPAYPETIQLQLRDAVGGEWWFVTWDADYSPSDPADLAGKEVIGTDYDELSGSVRIGFSDGTDFDVVPTPQADEVPSDPSYWQLFTPDGLTLSWGPCHSWDLRRTREPA